MEKLKEYIHFRRQQTDFLEAKEQTDEPVSAAEALKTCLLEMELFLNACQSLKEAVSEDFFASCSMDELAEIWDELYDAIKPDRYEKGWLYPLYAKDKLTDRLGGLLSMVYADLLCGGIFYAVQQDDEKFQLLRELFVICKEQANKSAKDCSKKQTNEAAEYMADTLCRMIGDFYCEHVGEFADDSIRLMLLPDENTVAAKILSCETDLSDLRYLYRYGYYIGENEKTLAAFMNSLDQNRIDIIAETFVGGYVKGFAATGKDITKKKTVKVEYPLGFERVVRRSRKLFAEEGLKAAFVPEAVLSVTGRGQGKRGVFASALNRRFDFDHKDDRGWYLDDRFRLARIRAIEGCYEAHKEEARVHGGPAVIEVFGETEFHPDPEKKNYTYTDEQNKINLSLMAESQKLSNRYIPGDERSFTIIAFPLPEIGEQFQEIFQKIVEVNTLDYELYRDIQQKLIEALDKGSAVEVCGANGNCTNILVRLHELSDPKTQTNFENCVADVNIPVGEVFTSPLLEGTNGTLFVSHVYLGAYEYHDLKLEFKDGMITDYMCSNFKNASESRRFIEDNILHHHTTLPIGEFAIGTNTLAYRLARDYQIEAKLPILIMEKTGPHFAVGDTCYSYAEDIPMRNPDGRECIARDNSISVLRNSDDEAERNRAYFHCHTDITIPFEELGRITVLEKDGTRTDIIRDGRFVLEGTKALNEPLDEAVLQENYKQGGRQ